MSNYEQLVALIASECAFSEQEARENLQGVITNLQELKLTNDFRRSDLANECEGLLGVRYNSLFFDYASEQLSDENIPQDLWDKYMSDEQQDNDYFNPFEWSGMLGEDVMEDVINQYCY